jgi:Zn-dependent protease with chaperone function
VGLVISAIMFAPIGLGAWLASDAFDARTWIVLVVAAILRVGLSTGIVWLVLVRLTRTRSPSKRAPARLFQAVDRAAARVGVKPRAVDYILVDRGFPQANALALIPLRRIAFTSDLVRILDDDELEAVAAHELGHLDEPRSIVFARVVVGSLVTLPIVLVRPLTTSLFFFGPVDVALTMFFLTLVKNRWLRRLETRADRIAHRHHSNDPAYARALEKIHRHNMMPAVLASKGTHPDLWDRMVAAGVTPAFAKPAKPDLQNAGGAMYLLPIAAGAIFALFASWTSSLAEEDVAAVWAHEARAALEHGDAHTALDMYAAAAKLHAAPDIRAGLAWAEATTDACDRAANDLKYATTHAEGTVEEKGLIAHATEALAACQQRNPRNDAAPTN